MPLSDFQVQPLSSQFNPNSVQSYVAVSNHMATTYPYYGHAQNGYPYLSYYVQGIYLVRCMYLDVQKKDSVQRNSWLSL